MLVSCCSEVVIADVECGVQQKTEGVRVLVVQNRLRSFIICCSVARIQAGSGVTCILARA